MKSIRRTTLSGKIALIFAVFLIAMMAMIVIILQVDSTAMADEIIQTQTATSIEGLSARIATIGADAAKKTATFSNNTLISEAMAKKNEKATSDAFNQVCRAEAPLYAVLTDETGAVLFASDRDKDFSGMACIKATVASGKKKLTAEETLSYEIFDGQVYMASSMPIVAYDVLRGTISCLELISDDKLLDELKQLTGCEFSIITGDERVSTTLMKDDVRENGTKISAEVVKTIATTKAEYNGRVKIFDVPFSVIYHPQMNKNGEIAFITFSAVNIESIEARKVSARILCIVLITIAAGVAVAFSLIYLNKVVKRPVKQIVRVVENFRSGRVGISDEEAVMIETTASDEIGQIANSLRGTADSLKSYIGEILAVLGAISEGNLTVRTSNNFVGDFVGVKTSLDGILTSLGSIVRRISESSHLVAMLSERITGVSGQLASGATEQAATVEELSASLLEVSTQTKVNAEAADAAAAVSLQTTNEVATGQKKMAEMLDSMKNINMASGEIEKIIKTIDDIAFQTNILALNAAVEAARAGNAGKGFAVVADEVRNLASKSAEAARQTTTLIHNSISLVEGGTKIANSTAESFETIIKSTEHSTDLIARIATASNDQATVIAQLNEGMKQISSVIQSTSATAEESAATAVELSQQAGDMKKIVGMFRF